MAIHFGYGTDNSSSKYVEILNQVHYHELFLNTLINFRFVLSSLIPLFIVFMTVPVDDNDPSEGYITSV
jgi:hypothetical protein